MLVIYLLKQLREDRNMTLQQLSYRSNVSTSQLSSIENNEKHPTIPTMIKIAKALDVQVTELYKVEW